MKISLGLLIGAAAAAAIVHYLNTPEGKAFADRIKRDVEDMGDNVNGLVDELVTKGKSVFGNVKEQATN